MDQYKIDRFQYLKIESTPKNPINWILNGSRRMQTPDNKDTSILLSVRVSVKLLGVDSRFNPL